MKKSNVVILSIFLVLITACGTFFVTTIAELNIGDKVVMPRENMIAYQSLYKNYEEIDNLKDYVEENYYKEISEDKLYEGMKKGLFEILGDPYSVFMNSEEYTDYLQSSSGEYPGIGVYLTTSENNQIEVVSPIEDTPADRAGLLPKDQIIGVNGEAVNADMMDEVISKVKGEPGTAVNITIYRPSKDKTFDVDIVREIVDVKVVKSRMIDDQIGYLRLTQFDKDCASEFKTHMDDLIGQGAKKVVIDLRQNPGGYLDECIDIADSLLGKANIVSVDGRNGEHESFESDGKKYNVSLAVLVDGGSASASEILTGALKDNHAATIIGTTTFGKGIVQTFRPYLDGSGLKLTTAEYFTPNGQNIHGIGIEPDITLELDEHYNEIENPTDADDNQLQKALEVLRAE